MKSFLKTLEIGLTAVAMGFVPFAARAQFPVEEYAEVASLQGDGSQSYDLGFVPELDLVSQLRFRYVTRGGNIFYGAPGVSGTTGWRLFMASSSTYFDIRGAAGAGAVIDQRLSGALLTLGTDAWLELGNYYVKNLDTGTTVLKGSTLSRFATFPNMRFFTKNDYGIVYGLKVYRATGSDRVLLHDIVPIKNRTTGEGLFYDLTADRFLTNMTANAKAPVLGEAVPNVFFAAAIPTQLYDGTNPCTPMPDCLDNVDPATVLGAAQRTYLSYADNAHAGTGYMTIAGEGDYAACTNVVPFRIANKTQDGLLAVLPIDDYLIDGHATAEPTLVVSNVVTHALLTTDDFSVVFVDNAQPGEAKAYVTGKGDYAGHTLFTTFNVYSRSKRWLGTTSASASVAANWLGGKLPVAGDSVVLDETSADNAMTWDLPIATLGGWMQTNYTGTVTFKLGPDFGGGGTMVDGVPWLRFASDVVVASGRWTHMPPADSANTLADETYKLNIESAGKITVGADAVLDADGCGFAATKGPGGSASGLCAHGGFGFCQRTNGYGSVRYPMNYGSGGAAHGGGGAIRLKAVGAVTVEGTVRARGLPVTAGNHGATASGGSILIEAADLIGGGSILVTGGCEARANCGGGGRLAVHLTGTNDFARWTGTLDAQAGAGGSLSSFGTGSWGRQHSGPGTIYLRHAGEAADEGTLIVRSDRQYPCVSASIPRDDEWTVGSFVMDGGEARFRIPDFRTLVVKRDLKVRGGYLWQGSQLVDYGAWLGSGGTAFHGYLPCGTVRFDNSVTNVHVVEGANHLEKWVVDTPGTELRFGTTAADVFVVTGGTFRVAGTASDRVALLPAAADGTWGLSVTEDATVDIVYAALSNSVASRPVSAPGSRNLGGNVNWSFPAVIVPGETITWAGTASTAWNDPANWDRGRAPVVTDVVVVPAGTDFSPTLLGADLTYERLEVASGATLTLGGIDLTVSNRLEVAGRLVATQTETLRLCGDAAFSDGAFVPASSTVLFAGDGMQSAALGGNAFRALRLEKSGGGIAFAGSFAATSVVAKTTAPVALSFSAGSTLAAGTMLFSCAAGRATLSSSVPGSAWCFAVARSAHFVNVDVTDGAATVRPCCADTTSTGHGTNPGWVFGADFAMWSGGVSADFRTAANWLPAAVPTATTEVFVLADGGTVAVENPSGAAISVAALTLDGDGGTALFATAGALAVAGDVTVGSGATLSLGGYDAAKTTVGGDFTVQAGGLVTHPYNDTTERYKIDLAVTGCVTVAKGGAVDVYGKGYARGRTAYGTAYNGWSFAATVANVISGKPTVYSTEGVAAVRPTYGPAKDAYLIGPGYTSGHEGGGAVRIVAGGTVRVDGTVAANGAYSIYDGYGGGAGCGGSILIRAPSLAGSGVVSADSITPHSFNDASGGRVSVHVAKNGLRDFTGRLSAWSHGTGGGVNYCWTMCMCGTVYTDVGGVEDLRLDQGPDYGILNQAGYVVLPADRDGDDPAVYETMRLTISGKARLVLSADLTVRDLDIAQRKLDDWAKEKSYPTPIVPTLDLNGHVLTVIDYDHRFGKRWGDAVTNLVFDSSAAQTGRLVWKPRGLSYCVR